MPCTLWAEWNKTPQCPCLYSVGHGSHAQQDRREKPLSITWQGQLPGWGLKDLPLGTKRHTIYWWITRGCIWRQNKLFRKEIHFKSSVFTAGKPQGGILTLQKGNQRSDFSGGDRRPERVRRRDFKLPTVKPSSKRTKKLGEGGKEGHGRESRSLNCISVDTGANTGYCPKPRKTWAHNEGFLARCWLFSHQCAYIHTEQSPSQCHLQVQEYDVDQLNNWVYNKHDLQFYQLKQVPMLENLNLLAVSSHACQKNTSESLKSLVCIPVVGQH